MELGSGCGLVGLVLACLGARVLLTDLPHVLVTPQQQPSWPPQHAIQMPETQAMIGMHQATSNVFGS